LLTIRLSRMGAKKKPVYRVVVIDKQFPRNGRFVEILGHYDPRKKPALVEVNRERAEHWLRMGAQPSETVRSLLRPSRSAPPSPAAPAV